MAERRMFAKSIVEADNFLDMPASARCLYFTFGMEADDDGFVNSPKGVMRLSGASEKDLDMLISNKFIIAFDSGVIVIRHWNINNYLQRDRYKETKNILEKEQLKMDSSKSYFLTKENRIRYVYDLDTQVNKDKVNKDKDSRDYSSKGEFEGGSNTEVNKSVDYIRRSDNRFMDSLIDKKLIYDEDHDNDIF